MPTWKGLKGLNAAATSEGPRLMATATIGRKPSRRVRRRRTGTKAISSSSIWISMPPVANARPAIGMTSRPRPERTRTIEFTSRASAPVRSTTENAPPTRKT